MQDQPGDFTELHEQAGPRPPEPPVPEPAAPPVSAPVRGRYYYDDPRRKSPVLALVLSMLPGVGQIYVGYYQQGFTNAVVFASIVALLSADLADGADALLGVFLAFFWFYNVIDAWRRAAFYNNALAGIGPAKLPEEFTLGGGRGTLAGGVALVIVGVVALSHTLFGVPLDWLGRWWPAALIGAGAWLAYPAVAKKRRDDRAAE
jgi:TM2 domain-containing membrane protein YozV